MIKSDSVEETKHAFWESKILSANLIVMAICCLLSLFLGNIFAFLGWLLGYIWGYYYVIEAMPKLKQMTLLLEQNNIENK